MIYPKPPTTDDFHLKRLVQKINATYEPIYLEVTPEPNTKLNDCFPAVQKKVEHDGGRLILGWQIWKSDYIIEAECHAVWEAPDGELRDITPKHKSIQEIMFIEDDNIKYEGKQIDNIRLNITHNKLVDDLILVAEHIFIFENIGERANSYDLTDMLTNKQKEAWLYLKALKDLINLSIQDGRNKENRCYCNSGKLYKNCHGKDLKEILKKAVSS